MGAGVAMDAQRAAVVTCKIGSKIGAAKNMTPNDWDIERSQIDSLRAMANFFEHEHRPTRDEDQVATAKMVNDVRAIHRELVERLGDRPEVADGKLA